MTNGVCRRERTAGPTRARPSLRLERQSPFDTDNLATWRKELAAGGACETVTAAFNTRVDEKKEQQLFANASTFAMIGRVTDAATSAPLDQVCITPGKPGQICWARTDKAGWYLLDLGAVFAKEGFFEIFFVKTGYPEQHSVSRMLSGRARIDHQMTK